MTNYQHVELNNFNTDSIKGNLSENSLNSLFFSELNLDAIQLGIKNLVAKKTNGKHILGRQSDTELRIIMRSIYLQYGRNLNEDIILQVKDLNKCIIDDLRFQNELNSLNDWTIICLNTPKDIRINRIKELLSAL